MKKSLLLLAVLGMIFSACEPANGLDDDFNNNPTEQPGGNNGNENPNNPGGENPTPDPDENPFASDAAFVCSTDDSANAVFSLGTTTISGKTANGFKLGKSKQQGKFTSKAVGVSGDKYLNFYAVAWKNTTATLYFRVNGGATQSVALKDNSGATGNPPYVSLNYSTSDHYSVKLEGLTATSTIEFSTNADFAFTTHSGSAPDIAPRVIVCGIKLSNGSTGGNQSGGNQPGGETPTPEPAPEPAPEVKTATVAQFLAAAVGSTIYELTGVISNVTNTTYGNFDLTDSTGTVYIYGLCSPTGEQKYWVASGAKEGDTITVQTVRSSHNGTAQGKNAIFVKLVPGEGGNSNENPNNPGGNNGNNNPETPSDDDIPTNETQPIKFQDANTKLLCTLLWDENEDGEFSYEEAAAVTDLGTAFKGSAIIAFTELEYFTSLKKIADSAFEGCAGLIKITLPKQITSIGDNAFSGCSNLKKIDIPDSVTSINEAAFYECKSLTSATIGNGTTKIESFAFQDCTSLASVTIGNCVTSIGYAAFSYCSSLVSITIPDSVTSIEAEAFYECKKLTSITIPNNVTSIGQQAFCDCSRLQEVYCKATTPPTGGKYMFDGTPEQQKIYVPAESAKIYKSATGWSRYASNIIGYDF